jgi:hypothetical protein
LPEASKGCHELIKCNCKKRCVGWCKCCGANLQCTQLLCWAVREGTATIFKNVTIIL